MKIKILTFISLLLLTLSLAAVGCDKTSLPSESTFVLTISEMDDSYSINEDINITASLKNSSNHSYYIAYGAEFITILLDSESDTFISIRNEQMFYGRETIKQRRTFSFEALGDYTVNIYCRFYIDTMAYEYSDTIVIHVV